jgi:hypothetical protein
MIRKDGAVELRQSRHEIIRVLLHHQLVTRPILDEAEWPRADGLGGQCVERRFADDHCLVAGGNGRQVGIRDREGELDGQRIDRLHACHHTECRPQHGTDILVQQALVSEYDIG